MIPRRVPCDGLRPFLALLESRGTLCRITEPVDPRLDIAAVTMEACHEPDGGPALLFEKPSGSHYRVATNLFGSLERVCCALGVDHLDQLTGRMSTLLCQIREPRLEVLDRQIAALPEFFRYQPRQSACPSSERIRQSTPDLEQFPFLQNWPDDGNASGCPRYMTLPLVLTRSPDGESVNAGIYRVQIRGRNQVAIRWKPGSGAARHAELYAEQGAAMPVAIALGGEPAALFSAMFPLPGQLDELTYAGFLQQRPLQTSACDTVPLQVPHGAELVVEGFVTPGDTVTEGPFGNHTGFYDQAGPAARLQVTAVNHRPDAIIPATLVGPPPMEDCWMTKAWEKLLQSFLKHLVPGVTDIHLPLEWSFQQSAIISLENPKPGMVREIAGALWGMPWFASGRLLIFIDSATTAAEDLSAVSWRCINLLDYGHDLIFDTSGRRLALDATGCGRSRPPVAYEPELLRRAAALWERIR